MQIENFDWYDPGSKETMTIEEQQKDTSEDGVRS